MIYAFSEVELNTDRHLLTRRGEVISVEPQVFDILRILAENAGVLVTKDQLMDEVWGGRIVSEATVGARINAARSAVGDNGKEQAVIRTVPRRGFELVADVTIVAPDEQTGVDTPHQTVRYASATDGRSIAWSSAGDGKPVLLSWHHLTHLELDWSSQLVGPFYQALASKRRVIRFDNRGTGLSDPLNASDTFDHHVEDICAVADSAGLERFPIVALLQGAAFAIRFAARHPERVSRLVLINCYARGRAIRQGAPEMLEHDPFIALLKSGAWGDPNNGFMRAWATIVSPLASFDETTELIELFGKATTTADALLQRNLIDHLEVTGDLAAVTCPSLVIQARLGAIHPVQEGRLVAAGIPNAEFVEVDSANSILTTNDQAYQQQVQTIVEFLDRDAD